MAAVDLRLAALRLKVVEMMQAHLRRRQVVEAPQRWRRWILPN